MRRAQSVHFAECFRGAWPRCARSVICVPQLNSGPFACAILGAPSEHGVRCARSVRFAGIVLRGITSMRAKRHLRFSAPGPFAPFSERRRDTCGARCAPGCLECARLCLFRCSSRVACMHAGAAGRGLGPGGRCTSTLQPRRGAGPSPLLAQRALCHAIKVACALHVT